MAFRPKSDGFVRRDKLYASNIRDSVILSLKRRRPFARNA